MMYKLIITKQKGELNSGKCLVVYKADIERLITEAMQIKEYLPKVSIVFISNI